MNTPIYSGVMTVG